MKPKWEILSKEYKYIAKDYHGIWWAFTDKPESWSDEDGWTCDGFCVQLTTYYSKKGHDNWRSSLEKRPRK